MVPGTRRRSGNCCRCGPPSCIQIFVFISTVLTVLACCVSGALLLFGLDYAVVLIYRSVVDYIPAAFLFFVAFLAILNCSLAYCGLYLESKILLVIVVALGGFTMLLQLATSMTTIGFADENRLIEGINVSVLRHCSSSRISDLQAELQCCVFSCPITNCTSDEKFHDCVAVLSNNQKDVLYVSFGIGVLALIFEMVSTYLICYGISLIRKYEHYDII